jgi:hypothetical protein
LRGAGTPAAALVLVLAAGFCCMSSTKCDCFCIADHSIMAAAVSKYSMLSALPPRTWPDELHMPAHGRTWLHKAAHGRRALITKHSQARVAQHAAHGAGSRRGTPVCSAPPWEAGASLAQLCGGPGRPCGPEPSPSSAWATCGTRWAAAGSCRAARAAGVVE